MFTKSGAAAEVAYNRMSGIGYFDGCAVLMLPTC
jgi:hypothetical protein